MSIRDQLRNAIAHRYSRTDSLTFSWAPGRVNLIGDHTDYNQGFVLPMTIDQGVYVMGAKRTDHTVRVYSENFDEEVQFELTDPVLRGPLWHNFVRGMVGAMHNRYRLPCGFDAIIYGTVPVASGLSSSAAVEVSLLMFLDSLYNAKIPPAKGAMLCQEVEHTVIGVQCGIMDQFSARLGKAGHALYLDCRTLAYRALPFALGDRHILIVDSHVPRSLASSKYNERRSECDHAVGYLQRIDNSIRSLRDVSSEFLEAHVHELIEPMRRRSLHVVYENERVQAAADALVSGDADMLGSLMNASHSSLRDDYEVSCAELDFIVSELQSMKGVYGARMTGAGFGGCVVSLVDADAITSIKDQLTISYKAAHQRVPTFIEVTNNLEAGVESP